MNHLWSPLAGFLLMLIVCFMLADVQVMKQAQAAINELKSKAKKEADEKKKRDEEEAARKEKEEKQKGMGEVMDIGPDMDAMQWFDQAITGTKLMQSLLAQVSS
jgi:predicted Holliday junction resolvase-like endonuclease